MPTAVSVITALTEAHEPIGMVVGTFTSVSLDPPLVGFLPDRKSRTWPLIEAAGHFCANILAADQTALCRQIAGKGEDRFAGIDYTVSGHGLPIIANALASIECRIHSVNDAGDHFFVLGEVLGMEAVRAADPLLFFCGKYGGFADLN
ncbi:flavin reductase family protein [Sphingobium sp.]|uniref:flavin reductase family protein n=1 Tax=Sphingobium sp. TaxID=1912891 RepID=UPI0028BE1C75|nr:flavin reductase family protein [Sphingobium sp.]